MKHAFVFVGARPRRVSIVRVACLFAHAVLDVRLGLVWAVEARARLCLHLERVDMRLASCGEFRSILRELGVIVLSRTRMLHRASFETVVFSHRPEWCLRFVLDRWLVVIRARYVAQTFVVDEFSYYSSQTGKRD